MEAHLLDMQEVGGSSPSSSTRLCSIRSVRRLLNATGHAWRSGSASRSHREGRGFESLSVHLRGLAQLGARALWEREVASSILASPTFVAFAGARFGTRSTGAMDERT